MDGPFNDISDWKFDKLGELFGPLRGYDAPTDAEEAGYFDERGQWRVEVAEWSDPERSLEREEFWQTLQDCVGKLPDRLAILFTLRELDGMETDALMETLNILSRNNVWVMLSRARQRLRQCLETNWFKA